MTDTSVNSVNLSTQMKNVLIIFCSIIILGIHLVMFIYSKDLFNIIMSFYIIGFAIIFVVYLQKKKQYMTSKEYSILSYISLFIIGLEVMVMIISFVSLSSKNYNKPYYNQSYNSYSSGYKYLKS